MKPHSSHYMLRITVLILAALLLPSAATADIDKKFYNKAANTVWGMELPQFNPDADLSDTLYQNQSAVFIARYIYLNADYDNSSSPTKRSIVGISEASSTKAVRIQRNMIKLYDAAAVEDFTEFSVDAPSKDSYRGYTLAEIKHAFGARIIKPDGRSVDVDMNEALTVTTGKKNKDSEYKVAIPGLEPGDILDYFFYTEYFLDELSMPDFNVWFLAKYPTRHFTLDCRIAPELALEYGAYNGAPKETRFSQVDKQNQLFIELEGIESIDEDMPYFSNARQIPFLDIYVLNNNSRLIPPLKTARPGGIRHINSAYLMSDIAAAIYNSKIHPKQVEEAVSIYKDWLKANPEATDAYKADAAWMAFIYAISKNDVMITDRQMAKMFTQMLDKIDWPEKGRVAVTSSRNNVPVTDLVCYNDASYMVIAGDTYFFCSEYLTQRPGDIPPHYDQEPFVKFDANPDNAYLHTSAVYGNLPAGKATKNTVTMTTQLTMDPTNDENLTVSTDIRFTGAQKQLAAALISDYDCAASIEKFFGLKPMKKRKGYDRETEEEKLRENSEVLAQAVWDTENATVESFEAKEFGSTPDEPDIVLSLGGTVPGTITQAGNNIMVNIGRFIGKQQQIKGTQRERTVSILRPAPVKYDTTIKFEIPEGYEIVESSLDDLNRSIVLKEASFNTEARLDGRTLTVRVVERYPRSLYNAESWPALLQVGDALYEFTKASVILRRL